MKVFERNDNSFDAGMHSSIHYYQGKLITTGKNLNVY